MARKTFRFRVEFIMSHLKNILFIAALTASITSLPAISAQKPNVILIYADDISPREFPMYESNVWSGNNGNSTTDQTKLAATPVLNRLARQGVMIETAWATTICSPSRAMMMTGRYAHLNKWWNNGDFGRRNGSIIPFYQSSPKTIGRIAKEAGYSTIWAGKTQMKSADLTRFSFDEGVFTPGVAALNAAGLNFNNSSDFIISNRNGRRVNQDTGRPVDSFKQNSWYWYPSVVLMNHPSSSSTFAQWPNTAASRANYNVNTYGPDVELDFILDFMERKHRRNKPFFVYHTTHLGHDAFDFIRPNSNNSWPGTPVINWNGRKYTRRMPNITGDNGRYNTRNTVTENGIHTHVEYLDYQVWQYLKKIKQLGIENDTIIIFASDNGTKGYGKGKTEKQRGVHVPLVIYAPGINMTKRGKQPVLASMVDILPTLADIMGVNLPRNYQIQGESLIPFLTTSRNTHRDHLYSYKGERQFIRGTKVMRDGRGNWWNVARNATPADMDSFDQITNWSRVPASYRNERDRLQQILNRFDLYDTHHD